MDVSPEKDGAFPARALSAGPVDTLPVQMRLPHWQLEDCVANHRLWLQDEVSRLLRHGFLPRLVRPDPRRGQDASDAAREYIN